MRGLRFILSGREMEVINLYLTDLAQKVLTMGEINLKIWNLGDNGNSEEILAALWL